MLCPQDPGRARSCTMFRKRKGTSGICGQLYESKLISLLYFRAIHDNRIAEFQLASNVDNIGVFDDICFKAKVEGFDKPVLVFIQAKHRENEKQTLTIDLATYFNSYLKIRHTFQSCDNDSLLNGEFNETECLFVIYTTARNVFGHNSNFKSNFSIHLYDLIDTGGTAKQPDKQEEDVEFLSKIAVEDQISSLAERIAKLIMGEENFQMSDELILRYHVILAEKVVDLSEIRPEGQRIAFFRHDFFKTNEEYLILFKNVLFKEILKRRKIKPDDVTNAMSEFFAEPTDASRLSKLIGTVITYNNGQLDLIQKYIKDFNKEDFNQLCVSRFTINQAVELAAKEILSTQEFKVPACFGNKDVTIRGSDKKIEKRLKYLTLKIKDLIHRCKSSCIVTIDDSMEKGFLQLNGGIAGAIGNIFVLDGDTKLMKVTDKSESLEGIAKRLYEKLIKEIHNLHEYKFSFKIYKFPKLLFDPSDYEANLAKDFLNKLLLFSNQANEKDVENILKREIEEYQHDHTNYFQAKTDAIFSKYHDDIQKWWMKSNEAVYLTKNDNRFVNAIHNIVKDPLMSLIKVTYMSKIKHYKHTFTEDAVKSLKLQGQHSTTVIITDNTVVTVVKVMQYLKNKEHVVLDIEYVVDLPTNDRHALRRELTNTNKDNVLIIVCDKVQNTRNAKKVLENIAEAVQNKQTIVITNEMTLSVLKRYFPIACNIVHDEKSSLLDMSEESQKSVLDSARLVFQGKKVKLGLILDADTAAYVKGDVLNKILGKGIIKIGELIVNKTFDDIKHLHIDRSVTKAGRVSEVRTLKDLEDDVVLVTADPGMGKTTLLSHLSLKTKEFNPDVWIVRINLLEYSRHFSKWKDDETPIDILETLKFMCQVILRGKNSKQDKVEIELEEQNDVVYLKHCTGDQCTAFELKLFLHFYTKGKVIFLFDGFDEICPHYANEVMKCIKTLTNDPRKHKIWITSRSYNEVKTILRSAFGSPYEINNFSYMEIRQFLETYWKFNLRLNEFNSAQLDNVKNFIEYVSTLKNFKPSLFVMPLHRVYYSAAHYLINEVKCTYIPLWIRNKNYNDNIQDIEIMQYKSDFVNDSVDGNPFHLLLTAGFVEGHLKSVTKTINKWDLESNSFAFYEQFLETKMKTIRFQEKNEMNIYYPDIIYTYDKELSDFILKHKKLAAYAIFCNWPWQNTKSGIGSVKLLFSMEDLIEMIKFTLNGGDKMGLISSSVANRYPIVIHTTFIHRTFTDYFAVEYVCDCLKNENSNERQKWIDFIFNVMFSPKIQCSHVHVILDHKIKVDKTLMSIFEDNKNVIFNLIMEQGRLYSEYIEDVKKLRPRTYRHWALTYSVYEQLPNFMLFFVKVLECHINKNNLKDFLDIVKRSKILSLANKYKSNVLIMFVFDIVRKIDKSLFYSVLRDNFSFLSHSTISSFVEMSSREIVDHLSVDEAYEEPPWSEKLS